MFIVKKAPAGRTAGADCLEGEHVMFGNQYALTMLFLPDLSSGRLSCWRSGERLIRPLFYHHQDIWNVYFLLRFFPRESHLTVRPSFNLNVLPP